MFILFILHLNVVNPYVSHKSEKIFAKTASPLKETVHVTSSSSKFLELVWSNSCTDPTSAPVHCQTHFRIKQPHCASDPLQLSMRASRICRRMFLALMKEVRSLMLYTTTKPSAQSTGSSSIHLASELCQGQHMLLFWFHWADQIQVPQYMVYFHWDRFNRIFFPLCFLVP